MRLDALRALLSTPVAPTDFVPPPRFHACRFDTFDVDAGVPGQAAAVGAVRDFAWAGNGLIARWFARKPPGLYLDGAFGVGKTHLLAACCNEADGQRRYLAFSEAMGLMTMHGAERAADLLAADLVCLDEFELDDPANTRLADLLLGLLVERGARLITTSNTVVGELGDGRMAVDLFRAQLARIGAAFTGVHVPGRDHRRLKVREGEDPPGWGARVEPPAADGWLVLDAGALDALLTEVPVVNLRRLAAALTGLAVVDLAPFADQLPALRFTALIDRLYDWNVPLRVRAQATIADLFPEPPLRSAFHRKHRRCQSRLTELCA